LGQNDVFLIAAKLSVFCILAKDCEIIFFNNSPPSFSHSANWDIKLPLKAVKKSDSSNKNNFFLGVF